MMQILKKHLRLVLSVLNENKELIIEPAIPLVPQVFSLPLFIISLTIGCQNVGSSWMRSLLIVAYLTSFIPQIDNKNLTHKS